jgi:hypothetical protein
MNINHCNDMVVRLHEIKIDARQFLKINIFMKDYSHIALILVLIDEIDVNQCF